MAAERELPKQPEPDSSERGRVGMLKEAYEEGKRLIDDQASELDSMRQRSIQFTAFTGSATAFLVGTALSQATRSGAFYWLAGAATFCSVAAILALIAVLTSMVWDRGIRAVKWSFRVEPARLIDRLIRPQVGAVSEATFYSKLARSYDQSAHENELNLVKLRRIYVSLLTLGSFQVLAWAALAWIFG